LSYLTTSIRHPNVYKVLKTQADGIFQSVIFPALCFGEEDQRLWEEDPQEYLRRESDITDEYFTPRSSAINFLVDLVRLRGKNHLKPIMYFVANLLMKNAQSPDARTKDGALLVIASLSDKLTKVKEFKDQIEPLLLAHVIPEFNSPHGFLRSKACYVFTQFWDFPFQNADTFPVGFRCVLNQLGDKELPVKIQAALNLRFLIRNEKAIEEVGKILPQLLERLLTLMNELHNDELVNTLELIVDSFEDKIAPYAVSMCAQLAEAFMRMAGDPNSNDEDSDESAIAAIECLCTIQTILRAVKEMPHLYPPIEQVLVPLLDRLMHPQLAEFFEEGVRIITYFTFYSPTISDFMWSLFPKLHYFFDNHGMDLLSIILLPYDNFISRATDKFLSGPYLPIVVSIYKRVLTDNKTNYETVIDACKLWESVLLNCKGRIDTLIEPTLEMALTRLSKTKRTNLKVILLEIALNSAYYNPSLFLQITQNKDWTKAIFELWFQLTPKFKRLHDKKICILALSAIIQLPFSSLPPIIQAGYQQILSTIIQLNRDREIQRKEEELACKAEEERYKEKGNDQEEEEEEDESSGELEEGTEDILSEDLISRAKQAQQFYEDEKDDDNSDEDEDDSDLEDEEDEFTSPLDNVDELITFVDWMKDLSTKNVNFYQSLLSQLPPNVQEMYKDVVQLSEKRKLELHASK